jgi:photosystem II stability/assembly factor-like uncharacterized protein
MKKIIIVCIASLSVLCSVGQFVPQPLNYPAPGYWVNFISISDMDHVWIGTIQEFGEPYSFAVRTVDGGESWIFDSIPVPGIPNCTSICEWDANTCFYSFTDASAGGGTIWKTTDGGETWSNMITTQFTGGFLNFYHAFSADTGVAMGDPTEGYFEIQLTYDGGVSWNRVPSSNIPPVIEGEIGWSDSYSAVGNSIWFATSKGRCFRSADRGMNWEVSEIVPTTEAFFDVCFSTEQKGVFFRGSVITSKIAVTSDGGVSWDTVNFPNGYYIMGMSRVGGFDGGFVATGWQSTIDVFFTPDLFSDIVQIGSNIMSIGSIAFLDAETGWIGGGESGTNEILKFTGLLTGVGNKGQSQEKMLISPNPASTSSLLRLPVISGEDDLIIRIMDMSGKVIFQEPIQSRCEWTTLDASDLHNGVYIVEIRSGNHSIKRECWVVQH